MIGKLIEVSIGWGLVMVFSVDIEIHGTTEQDTWAQAKYLVHGYDDVCWTDELDVALEFLKEQILLINKEDEK